MLIGKLHKAPLVSEQGVDDPQEFGGSGNDRFLVGLSFASLFEVIFFKVRAVSFDRASHNPDNSSCVGVASFGDFEFLGEFSGLFNHRVKSTEANEFSFTFKSLNIHDFSEEIDSASSGYARDGTKELDFFFEEFICLFVNKFCDVFSCLKERIKSLYFEFKELFVIGPFISNRGVSEFIEFFRRECGLSSVMRREGFRYFKELFFWCGSDFVSRAEMKEKSSDFLAEDTALSFKFREEECEKGFDFRLFSCNPAGNSFLFSNKVFKGISFFKGFGCFIYELKSSGNMISCPPGLYFNNSMHIHKLKFINNII